MMNDRDAAYTGVLSIPASRKRRLRGMTFVLALISLTVIMILGVLSLQFATNNLLAAEKRRNLVVAEHLAEGAADGAEAFLRYHYQGSPPTNRNIYYPNEDVQPNPAVPGSYLALTTGTCSATISPQSGNNGSYLKRFVTIANGNTSVGQTGRTVIEQLQERSFSLYSYFTDEETSSKTNDPIWFYSRDRIYGPVHTNDQFHIAWDTGATNPIFFGKVSASASTTVWGDAGTPNTDAKWKKVFKEGETDYKLNTPHIALPTSSDIQRTAAWGSTNPNPLPTTNGITIPNNGAATIGGIYVRGNCTIALRVDARGNQAMDIAQTTHTRSGDVTITKTVTVDLVNNLTKVEQSGKTTLTYTGTTNGVIFCDGSITGLSGTLADNYYQGSAVMRRNAWTIATDLKEDDGTASSDNIQITGNLTYKTAPDYTEAQTDWGDTNNVKAASLGIISQEVVIDEDCPTNLSINASILAGADDVEGGSFYYEGWQDTLKGNLNLIGGIIQKQRGPVGQFSGNQSVHGYTKNYNYDARFVDFPPPYFPSTYQYDVLSWQSR